MIYFITFILLFWFVLWVKVGGEVIKLELGDYIVDIDLYFVVLACVFVLFLLIVLARFFSFISSAFVGMRNKKKDREELLTLEVFFSIDLNNVESVGKLVKNLNEGNDKLLLIKTFNAGKTGNYSFFSNSITTIASKNCNLALLLSHKLISCLKKNKIAFHKFIEYCSGSISDKMLSLPFKIEYFILKGDWHNAIIALKEAIRLNIFLPFNSKKMLATFYCALAREYENRGNFKDAIKSLFRAQNCQTTFRPINYLKAELYIKLEKMKKACEVLEAEYEANPTPQIAKLYISLNSKNADKLCSLRPDYYFSHCILALSAINSGKYDFAAQHLENAIAKANYLSIYLIMAQLYILLQENDKAIDWLHQVNWKVLPDPGWKCKSCSRKLEQWDCKCSHCGSFDSVTISEL